MKYSKKALAGLAAASLLALALMAGVGSAASQAAPVNTAKPAVSGTATVGQTLTATNGTWSNTPTSYAYQWLRCNGGGNSCVSVSNGTQQTYTLVGADAGHTMRVRVTASNADGSATAESAQTAAVAAATAAVWSDSAEAEPSAFVAVTRTRIVWPASAPTSVYVFCVPFGTLTQLLPPPLQRTHW